MDKLDSIRGTFMPKVQPPVVAGSFYPADPAELRAQLHSFFASAKPESVAAPKALIAPHAGYIYSGPVAANAYVQLTSSAEKISRVVILAPSHRVHFFGIACSSADLFQTPLGHLEVDQQAIAELQDLPQVVVEDTAFGQEHSLEVHLPFLQECLGEFKIVPMIVGDTDSVAVDEVLERLWGGDETLIVISSDLSHYLEYEEANRIDAATSRDIENLQPEAIGYDQACGRIPISGLLLAAQRHQLHPTTLDLRNSGDTAGSKDRVVGYGAYAFA
jgi:AmmeMemoRadiSam system protein B